MSLLTAVNQGAPGLDYFIQNIGGPGSGVADAPCIKGTTLGTVRVGDPVNGLILRGDKIANIDQIRGGTASGGSLLIGSSTASFQNIALTDNLTTINTPTNFASDLTVTNDLTVNRDLYVSGDIVFTGPGSSVSGYYLASVPVAGQQVIANPAGLTAGVYSVVLATADADRQAQPSGIFVWSGTTWFGNAVSAAFSSTPGSPNVIIVPVAGGATLQTFGSGAPNGNVIFRKLLNAA